LASIFVSVTKNAKIAAQIPNLDVWVFISAYFIPHNIAIFRAFWHISQKLLLKSSFPPKLEPFTKAFMA